MPTNVVCQHRNLVFRLYNEEGAPHNEPNVEVQYLGKNRKVARGKVYIANFIVPYDRNKKCYIDKGGLEKESDIKLALEVLQLYRDKFLRDWDKICSSNARLPYKLKIGGKKEVKCGLVFWPIKRDGERCVAVSYKGCSPYAEFRLRDLKLIDTGAVPEKHLTRAEKIIKERKKDWMKLFGWKEEWDKADQGRPLQVYK